MQTPTKTTDLAILSLRRQKEKFILPEINTEKSTAYIERLKMKILLFMDKEKEGIKFKMSQSEHINRLIKHYKFINYDR